MNGFRTHHASALAALLCGLQFRALQHAVNTRTGRRVLILTGDDVRLEGTSVRTWTDGLRVRRPEVLWEMSIRLSARERTVFVLQPAQLYRK